MAMKRQVSAPEGSAHVRFVMLEADVTNGNLSEFAATIANVLKSSSHQKALAPASNGHLKEPPASESVEATADEAVDETADEAAASNGVTSSPKTKPRKATISKPKILELDLKSGAKPLEAFLSEKAPESITSKYLVIAAWFKECRQIDSVTIDHVYTSFRAMSWGTGTMADLTQPFRDLKKNDRGDYQDGKFTINHIGVGIVEKMNSGG